MWLSKKFWVNNSEKFGKVEISRLLTLKNLHYKNTRR